MMRLLADAYTRTERHAVARSAVAPHQEPRLERSSDAPSDELIDIYAAALIAVPVALFLRWMWP